VSGFRTGGGDDIAIDNKPFISRNSAGLLQFLPFTASAQMAGGCFPALHNAAFCQWESGHTDGCNQPQISISTSQPKSSCA